MKAMINNKTQMEVTEKLVEYLRLLVEANELSKRLSKLEVWAAKNSAIQWSKTQ